MPESDQRGLAARRCAFYSRCLYLITHPPPPDHYHMRLVVKNTTPLGPWRQWSLGGEVSMLFACARINLCSCVRNATRRIWVTDCSALERTVFFKACWRFAFIFNEMALMHPARLCPPPSLYSALSLSISLAPLFSSLRWSKNSSTTCQVALQACVLENQTERKKSFWNSAECPFLPALWRLCPALCENLELNALFVDMPECVRVQFSYDVVLTRELTVIARHRWPCSPDKAML